MKADAGWKLCTRKPALTPVMMAASTAALPLCRSKAMIENDAAEIAQTPAARPSMPSEKLTTLTMSTIPMTVIGTPASPMSTRCTNGSVNVCTRTPSRTGSSTAVTWPSSLIAGGRSYTSSSAPTKVMSAAPARIARQRSSCRGSQISDETRTPQKIARPPRRGGGRSDRPRPPGWSTAGARRAMRELNGGTAAVTAPAPRAAAAASHPEGCMTTECHASRRPRCMTSRGPGMLCAVDVGVVGLGYVGLPLAAAFAQAGFGVTGFDVDARRVAQIRDEGGAAFAVTTDPATLSEVDAVVVCVPTPLTANREPDLAPLLSAAHTLARTLRRGQLVVLESTTFPGTTRERLAPILEGSGLRAGSDFHLAYSPERLDPGRVSEGLRTPPKVAGGLTPACRDRALALYRVVCDEVVPVS